MDAHLFVERFGELVGYFVSVEVAVEAGFEGEAVVNVELPVESDPGSCLFRLFI